MANIFTFYSKEGCIYCASLESDLKSMCIPYTKKVPCPEDIAALKVKTGMSTFPMIFIGEECIGGYKDFNHMVMTNTLGEKLNAHNIKCSFTFDI